MRDKGAADGIRHVICLGLGECQVLGTEPWDERECEKDAESIHLSAFFCEKMNGGVKITPLSGKIVTGRGWKLGIEKGT